MRKTRPFDCSRNVNKKGQPHLDKHIVRASVVMARGP
jgi:hypothetical protein